MDLRGKAALVTGGSRGLGAALGETLAKRGARVVLVARPASPARADSVARPASPARADSDARPASPARADSDARPASPARADSDARHEEALARVVRKIRAEGGDAHWLAFDVGDKESAHRITGAAAALVGPIDVLVQNASTLGPMPMPFLLDTACEDLQAVLETNLIGPFRVDKIVGGSMALRKTGVIVHVSSDAAVSGYPRWGAYGVSKAALDQLGRVLGAELGEHGVRVFSVDPGEMDTKMHADAMPDADRATLERPERVAERIVAMIEGAEKIEPGARLVASEWRAS